METLQLPPLDLLEIPPSYNFFRKMSEDSYFDHLLFVTAV